MRQNQLIAFSCFLLLQFSNPPCFSEPDNALRFDVRFSKASGILYLFQTLLGDVHRCQDLPDGFLKQQRNNIKNKKQVENVRSVFASQTTSLPSRNTESVLEMLAASSPDVNAFTESARAVLSVDSCAQLSSAISTFLPSYEKYFWKPGQQTLIEYKRELERQSKVVDFSVKLSTVRHIYQSNWPGACHFTAVLVPIVGSRKNGGSAHSLGPVIVMEAVRELRHENRPGIGVVFHEFCHSLWGKRDENVDHRLSASFKRVGGLDAYNLLDEALATALGNYIESLVTGSLAKEPWYAGGGYESDYAKAIYPVITKYFSLNRPFDDEFASSITDIFKRKFPKGHNDPVVAFWNTIGIFDEHDRKTKVPSILPSTCHYWTSVSGVTAFELETKRHPEFTLLFMITPQRVKELRKYSFSAAEVGQIETYHTARQSRPWCKTKDGRWAIVCVGENEDQQI